MLTAFSLFGLLSVSLFLPASGSAQEAPESIKPERPIQALLVTGGCCHDYDRQKLILTRGISARANVRWTVVQQGGKTTNTKIPLYDNPDWARGFDIVVHNECFAHVKDKEFVDRILKPHRDGTPAILIHCAMHCYRTGDDRWFEFVGMQSPGHGAHYAFRAENMQPDHPIMRGFGPAFEAPKGELYHAMKVFKTATPLAQANRRSDGKPQVCVWTNRYGPKKTRVFGTTIGHYNETMVEPKYLDMLARGLLWATGRDPAKHFRSTSETVNDTIAKLATVPVKSALKHLPGNCCGEGNLAYKRPVTSLSVQKGNEREHLTDGLLNTRWCASGPQKNEWVTVDLEEARDVRAVRLHWEKRQGVAYRYTVEASADNRTWTTIVDASQNRKRGGVRQHQVKAPKTRYLRVTFLGARGGLWGSLWELEASAGGLPELAAVPEGGAAASIADVTAPAGFDVTMFGKPPEVNYPVCITASETGEVFVGVDEQGSLGKKPGGGRVLRCLDTDGDGTADRINVFARMDHPRGLIYDAGSLWVLHPPFLSVFRDTDGDGTAEKQETLITGISTDEVNKRGADHTTNGIAMGIDGWIYIAVGDFGMHKAVGKDGATLSRRGGGIVRVRPDGTEMEVFSWGQRNIVDVAIDPYLNIFTRDNTNDGGGWDIRLSHILQTANYGYPSLYRNFTDETMPPLADYGGGSGCGAMFFHDGRWPKEYRHLLLTCDWGLSKVFSHNLPAEGATFAAEQSDFLKLPRPTDICADGSGRMYVASWKNGKFDYGGPNVGFVAMVTPRNYVPPPVRSLTDAAPLSLVELFKHPSARVRLAAQRELLRDEAVRIADAVDRLEVSGEPTSAEVVVARASAKSRTGRTEDAHSALRRLAEDRATPMYARVAAIQTLSQLSVDHAWLRRLSGDVSVRAHCFRAMTDRLTRMDPEDFDLLLAGLADASPRVRAAAIIGMPRLLDGVINQSTLNSEPALNADHEQRAARALLPLTHLASAKATGTKDAWRLADPQRVIPHLAVAALVRLNAHEVCLAEFGGSTNGRAASGEFRDGALRVLSRLHTSTVVNGLLKAVTTTPHRSSVNDLWTALIRLYHREGDFTAGSPKWWGTRPDTTGPYYHRVKWSESDRIAAAVKAALAEADAELAGHIRAQLKRHVVKLEGLSAAEIAGMKEPQKAIVLPKVDPKDPKIIANMAHDAVVAQALKSRGDAVRGQKLFIAQSCINCHTVANGQQPKGPHLVDIGKRYKPGELLESILKPNAKLAQGFESWTFVMESGKTLTGFVVLESAESITIRQADGLSKEFPRDEIEERVKQEASMMPKGIVANLTPEQLADLLAYLKSLR